MERFICVHGHFYQPPRENPWLEAVELQDSAYPYHDWNERITAECYGPNTAARILDANGRIVQIVNNYAWISFNFGPTLLSWLERSSPETYTAILEADRQSQTRFSGHGSALAQAYNHMIMPLASSRDKYLQILWGIRDFEHRFGRRPEGIWLPETAVDLETLDIAETMGIRFTILSPNQASRVRRIGGRGWRDVSGGRIDPTQAYRLNLPSGRMISLFFYSGPISSSVAFEGFLSSGEEFAGRLAGAFSETRTWPQLVHIATDGETYGHHHPHGDMALAYAIGYIESQGLARITNYGEYLEGFPPTCEAEIFENSSWSCSHGVERWRSDCGCNSGMHGGWNQAWRGPLREGLDWLRDSVLPRWEEKAGGLVRDPASALDDYISVLLDRSPENVEAYISRHASLELPGPDKPTLLKLMELRRQSMLMYTSCGWFFDELSGIETVQVIQYAGRVIQLFRGLFGEDIERRFLQILERAKSNIPEHRDGALVYQKFVKPAMVDLQKVGAHYAISSVFEDYPKTASIYCYTVEREDYRSAEAGRARFVSGRVRITSRVTWESEDLSMAVLHFGDHNLSAGVRSLQTEETYQTMARESAEPFSRADFAELIRVIDRDFGGSTYSLKSLFKDEQRQVLSRILDSSVGDAEALYLQLYEHHAPLMRFLADLGAPVPRALQTATEVVFNADLRRALGASAVDVDHIAALLKQVEEWHVELDSAGVGYALERMIERLVSRLKEQPMDIAILQDLEGMVELTRTLPFEVDLWKAQNICYEILHTAYSEVSRKARREDGEMQAWLAAFISLGEKMGVKIGTIEPLPGVDAVMQEVLSTVRVPGATYRLQFGQGFGFADAQALIPYLKDLGITDCYTSPLIMARPGSTHGYDVVDHSRLNPDYGSYEDFLALSTALREEDIGLLMDVVSNHMSIAESSNGWWMDVLENGPSSIYASYFDINWEMAKPEMENRVLLPILEDQYGRVLESGKLQLAYEDGGFFVRYYQTRLPLEPCSYRTILQYRLDTLAEVLGEENEHLVELESVLTALSHLPAFTDLSPEMIAERSREKEVIKRRISALHDASPEVRNAIDLTIRTFNGNIGDPRSFDLLGALLDVQAYRLAYWRVATDEINYRRFFDVNEMAGIRVELPEAFQASHQLVLRLLAEGHVTGLRIDHSDGLWNPEGYFRKLQREYVASRASMRLGEQWRGEIEDAVEAIFARLGNAQGLSLSGMQQEGRPSPAQEFPHPTPGLPHPNPLPAGRGDSGLSQSRRGDISIPAGRGDNPFWQAEKAAGGRSSVSQREVGVWEPPAPGTGERSSPEREEQLAPWISSNSRNGGSPRPLYMVAEKILLGGESPPEGWLVYGTTGYDFLNLANGLFVDSGNRRAFDSLYRAFAGARPGFHDLANITRKIIMVGSLASEINNLGNRLERIAERNRWYRDFTLASLTFTIREVIACLPVYRTYITGKGCLPSQRDQGYIRTAVAEARRRNPRTARPVFDFIQDTLLLQNFQDFREEDWDRLTDFVMRFQQITGPVMAKGVEDTAFYVYNRLVSLNEVGGNPEQFGVPVRSFHEMNMDHRQRWPHTLLATSTHDTKRSEDVRARIDVLSEMPGEWRSVLNRWSRLNARKKTIVDGEPAPDRNDEYLLYQTLIGVWPDRVPSTDDLGMLRERVVTYMLKATKEAKVHTSWVNPYNEYDRAVEAFVRRLLVEGDQDPFINSFHSFQRRIACYGHYNALSQALLKLTAPGVPDMYQGTELWDYSLVDPDNRRPVDYGRRVGLLTALKQEIDRAGQDLAVLAGRLLRTLEDGRIKLYVIYHALNSRHAHRQLFLDGDYLPLEATGERADHVCAFERALGDDSILVAVPRLVVRLTGGIEQPPLGREIWKDTRLVLTPDHAGRAYRNIFTGETLIAEGQDGAAALPLASVFARFPVAMLERVRG